MLIMLVFLLVMTGQGIRQFDISDLNIKTTYLSEFLSNSKVGINLHNKIQLASYKDLYNYFVTLGLFLLKCEANDKTGYEGCFFSEHYNKTDCSYDFIEFIKANQMFDKPSGIGYSSAQKIERDYIKFKKYQKGVILTSTIKFNFVHIIIIL